MAIACPFCQEQALELISLFGSQLLLSQFRCKTCGSYFEGIREDRDNNKTAINANNQGESIDGG